MNGDLAPVNFGLLLTRTLQSFGSAVVGMALIALGNLCFLGPVALNGSSKDAPPTAWALLALPGFVAYFLGFVVVAVEVIARLEDRRPSVGEVLRAAWSRSGTFFLLSLGVSLAAALGMFLLIVPGLMILIAWSLASVISVDEKLGFVASLKRSAQLTRGHRLSIFGTFLVLGVVANVFITVVTLAVGSLGGVALVIGVSVATALASGVIAALPAVALHSLRRATEGERTDIVASVFA